MLLISDGRTFYSQAWQSSFVMSAVLYEHKHNRLYVEQSPCYKGKMCSVEEELVLYRC